MLPVRSPLENMGFTSGFLDQHFGANQLYSGAATKPPVPGAPNLTHAPLSEHFFQRVAAHLASIADVDLHSIDVARQEVRPRCHQESWHKPEHKFTTVPGRDFQGCATHDVGQGSCSG